ncbi:MAG: hypothetical protein FWB78_00360 [Treponema sp.]|nr:hypothetical protein [Treponema sp.]
MLKNTTVIFMLAFTIPLHAQQPWSLPNEFGVVPPPSRTHYSAWAVSDPSNTEREAIEEAERAAIARLVQQIYVLHESISVFEITRYNSIINERGVLIDTTTSRLFLQGLRRKTVIRRDGTGRVTAFVLVYMTIQDIENTRRRARNETVAQTVHDFFRKNAPGMRPFNIVTNPERGYTLWLHSRTGMILGGGNNPSLTLNQINAFLRTLSITTFSGLYDGRHVLFVYDSNTLEIIARALQRQRTSFSLARPTLTIYTPPQLGNSVVVTGLERSRVDSRTNTMSVFSAELTRLVQGHSSRSIESFPLPSGANGLSGAGAILEFARSGSVPWSRFYIVFYIDSFMEQGVSHLGVPPHLFKNATVLVYDVAQGQIILSENMRNAIPIFDERNIAGSADMLLRRLLPAHIPGAISFSIEEAINRR